LPADEPAWFERAWSGLFGVDRFEPAVTRTPNRKNCVFSASCLSIAGPVSGRSVTKSIGREQCLLHPRRINWLGQLALDVDSQNEIFDDFIAGKWIERLLAVRNEWYPFPHFVGLRKVSATLVG
jgi:hypothetical protein